MTQYLLLRSNKQSGPYSAEELRRMGLKPYDLIWVDGKSAAWRYPGEIDELKPFAPPVEEQPYDRFYKKPSSEQKPQEEIAQASSQQATPSTAPAYTPAAAPQQANTPPAKKEKEYKRVFVTLPNGSVAAPKTPAPEPKKAAEVKPVQQKTVEPIGLDDLPPLPESSTIQYPKKSAVRSRTKALPLPAIIIIAVVLATGIGIFIGLQLNTETPLTIKSKSSTEQQQNVIPASTTGQELINSTDGQLIPDEPANVPPVTNQESSASEQIVPQKKTVEKPLDTNLQKPVTEQPVTDAVAINTAKKEEEAPVKKTVAKPVAPNLEKYVAVSSNDYQVGPFGGISKLALTVKNSSEYDLNLVVVQVEYLKVNKEVFKTENLYFRDVAANSSLTLDAPRSTRGNKVNYKVTLINSKDHLFHAGN